MKNVLLFLLIISQLFISGLLFQQNRILTHRVLDLDSKLNNLQTEYENYKQNTSQVKAKGLSDSQIDQIKIKAKEAGYSDKQIEESLLQLSSQGDFKFDISFCKNSKKNLLQSALLNKATLKDLQEIASIYDLVCDQ